MGAPSPLTAAVLTCAQADRLQTHLNRASLRRFWFSGREQGLEEMRCRPRHLGVAGGASVRPAMGEGPEGRNIHIQQGGPGGMSWDKLLSPRGQVVWRESWRKVHSRTGKV